LQTIAPSLTPQIIQAEVIEPLLQLAADPIPNIRFNVAKALEMLGSSFGTEVSELAKQRLLPALEQQKADQDADVRYFAGRAHQKIMVTVQGTFSPLYLFVIAFLITYRRVMVDGMPGVSVTIGPKLRLDATSS
jgi:hypothetical protein